MMPAVRLPYSAGRAPVIRRTDSRQPGIQGLAEHRNAFRQDDAVEAVLQAIMLAADVQLAEGILRHARRLQDHRIERGIVAARLVLNVLGGDGVGRGAGLGLDAVARGGQALGGDGDGFNVAFAGAMADATADRQARRQRCPPEG